MIGEYGFHKANSMQLGQNVMGIVSKLCWPYQTCVTELFFILEHHSAQFFIIGEEVKLMNV